MPTVVNIPDVGKVNFPDSMSEQEIADAIKTKILPSIQKPTTTTETGSAVKKPSFWQKFIETGAILGESGEPGAPSGEAATTAATQPLIPTEPLNEHEKAGLTAGIAGWLQASGHPTLSRMVASNPEFVGGVNEVARKNLDFMSSPIGIATLGLGAAPKAVQQLAMATFAAYTAKNAPERWKNIKQAYESGDANKLAEEILGATQDATIVLGGAGAAKGMVKSKAQHLGEAIDKASKEAELPVKEPTPIVTQGTRTISPEVVEQANKEQAAEQYAEELKAQDIQAQQAKQAQAKAKKNVVVPETPAEPEKQFSSVVEEIKSRGLDTKRKVQSVFPHLNREEAGNLIKLAYPEGVKAKEPAPISQPPPPTQTTPVIEPETPAPRPAAEIPVKRENKYGSFTTSKGSTYLINEDGTTTRNKSPRPEHPGEGGKQPTSVKTWYVTPEQADLLGEVQTSGNQSTIEEVGDGRIGVKWLTGPSSGKFETRTVVNPQKDPMVGLIPVESWGPNKSVHFGNKIVSVEPFPSKTVEKPTATSEPTPSGPGIAGMGGAVSSEFEHPIAEAHIGNPQVAPPAKASHPWLSGIVKELQNIGTTLKAISGQTLPRITAAHRETGESGARFLSSSLAARPLAATFSEHTLEGTGVDPTKFGAALVEDNLRSIREDMQAKASEAISKGNTEEADKLFAAADNVRSLIGAKKFPFKTEDEYQDFLADPSTKKAIANHIQQWNEVIEPQFKQAQMIDPDVELPTRGQQTGARVNLKAITEEEPGMVGVRVPESSRLTGTMRRKTPFGILAKGTGKVYEISYPELMSNTFTKQLEIANKNAFDKSLIDNGLAEIHKPGWKGTVSGEETKSFPIDRGPFRGKNIYVKKSLATEYESASNVYTRANLGKLTTVLNTLNNIALKSLTDFSVHTSNLMTGLFNSPVSGTLWKDYILNVGGRADVPVQLFRAFKKASQNNQAQLAELAKIGALRPQAGSNWGSRTLHAMDTTVRLVLDDTFQELAKNGYVPNTETARREFINQVGQYNKRAQGPVIRALRDTGLGPFATAGRAFTSMGVKMATLTPAVQAQGALSGAMLRASILSKWIGAASLLAIANYMRTGQVSGRPGTPVGFVDTGLNGKDGKPLLFPLFDVVGLGRALRVTGAAGAINTQRLGLTISDSADAAARDILNSALGVAVGPGARTLFVAGTGQQPALNVGRAAPVVQPGKNQLIRNIQEAAEDVNPFVKSILAMERGKTATEALSQQLPRFALRPGKPPDLSERYPQIVRMAHTYAFADDLVRRTRQEPFDKRMDFVKSEIQGMPPDEQTIVFDQLKRRKVFSK